MKSKSLFTKLVAFMLCVIMAISCLPVSAFAAEDGWESEIDRDYATAEKPLDITQDLVQEGDFIATVTVPAGETYYFMSYGLSGMLMQINGGEGVLVSGNPRMPYTWSITNDGAEKANYTITVAFPEGTMQNPATADLGDNVASIEAGNNQGYYFAYSAEQDGNLAVTVSSADGNWTYAVNNITASAYGDTQWSDSDPVVNPYVISVAAGDEIQIIVNTYNPADMWGNPAGNITVNLAYVVGCDHANTTTTNTATCTEAGVETVVCNDCGETISSTEVPALGHDYTGEKGACIRCGEYQIESALVFYDTGIAFQEFIGVQSMLLKRTVKNYTSFYVEADYVNAEGNRVVQVLNPVEDNKTYAGYDLPMVPYRMTDDIIITLYAEKNGIIYQSEPVVTSIQKLAMDKIEAYYAENNTAACRILVDMLVYGSETQALFGDANAADPAGELTEEYRALGTAETEEISGEVTYTGTGFEMVQGSMSLGSQVEIQLMFKKTNIQGCELRYTIEGQDTVKISAEDFKAYGKNYVYTLFALKPANFRSDITVGVYNCTTGEPVSVIYTLSAEAYAAQFLANGQYLTLLPAMMNYGDAVYAMFGA